MSYSCDTGRIVRVFYLQKPLLQRLRIEQQFQFEFGIGSKPKFSLPNCNFVWAWTRAIGIDHGTNSMRLGRTKPAKGMDQEMHLGSLAWTHRLMIFELKNNQQNSCCGSQLSNVLLAAILS